MKKDYIQPTMNVVKIKMQGHLLELSGTNATGLGDDHLDYESEGGDQEYAW